MTATSGLSIATARLQSRGQRGHFRFQVGWISPQYRNGAALVTPQPRMVRSRTSRPGWLGRYVTRLHATESPNTSTMTGWPARRWCADGEAPVEGRAGDRGAGARSRKRLGRSRRSWPRRPPPAEGAGGRSPRRRGRHLPPLQLPQLARRPGRRRSRAPVRIGRSTSTYEAIGDPDRDHAAQREQRQTVSTGPLGVGGDEDRPVPQVDAVRDQAERRQGRQRQHPSGQATGHQRDVREHSCDREGRDGHAAVVEAARRCRTAGSTPTT